MKIKVKCANCNEVILEFDENLTTQQRIKIVQRKLNRKLIGMWKFYKRNERDEMVSCEENLLCNKCIPKVWNKIDSGNHGLIFNKLGVNK